MQVSLIMQMKCLVMSYCKKTEKLNHVSNWEIIGSDSRSEIIGGAVGSWVSGRLSNKRGMFKMGVA